MVVLNTAGVHSHSVQVVQTPVFEEHPQSRQERTSSIQYTTDTTEPYVSLVTQTQDNSPPSSHLESPIHFDVALPSNVNPTVYPSVPPVPQYICNAPQQALQTAYAPEQNVFGSPELKIDLTTFIATGFLAMGPNKSQFSTPVPGQKPDIDPKTFLRQNFPSAQPTRAPTPLYDSYWLPNQIC